MYQGHSSSRRDDSHRSDHAAGMLDCTVFRNGDTFVGHMKSGKVHGMGYFLTESPAMYCAGEWHEGLLNGIGLQLGPGRQRYVGEFVRGAKSGVGIQEDDQSLIVGNFLEGEVHGFCLIADKLKLCETQGSFKEGLINGFGRIQSKDQEYGYNGHFKDGKYQGMGHETIRGSTYTGEFKQGKRDGVGAYSVYDSNYYGEWKGGERVGFGIERYHNKGVYQGDFSSDCKNGPGRYTDKTSGSVYVGHFKDGLRHGFGHLQVSPNCFYVGEWICDRKEGTGLMIEESGRIYYGQWRKNHREGKGIMIYSDSVYRGDWWGDRPHGRALFQSKDDSEEKLGVFEYGVLSSVRNSLDTRYANFMEASSYKAYLESSLAKVTELDISINRKIKKLEDSKQAYKEVLGVKCENMDHLMKEIKTRVDNLEITAEHKIARLFQEVENSEFGHIIKKFESRYVPYLDPRIPHQVLETQRVGEYHQSDRKYDRNRSAKNGPRSSGKQNSRKDEPFSRRTQEAEAGMLERKQNQRSKELSDINKRLSHLFGDVFGKEETPDILHEDSLHYSDVRVLPEPEMPRPGPPRPVQIQDEATSTGSNEDRVGEKIADLEEKERLIFVEKMALTKQKQEILMLIDELNKLKVKRSEIMESKVMIQGSDINGQTDKKIDGTLEVADLEGQDKADEGFRDQKSKLETIQEETSAVIRSSYMPNSSSVGKESQTPHEEDTPIELINQQKKLKKRTSSDDWEKYSQKPKIEKIKIAQGNSDSKFLYYDKIMELVLSVDNLLYRIKVHPGKNPKVTNLTELAEGSKIIHMFDFRGRIGLIVRPSYEVIFVDLFNRVYNKFDPFSTGKLVREEVPSIGKYLLNKDNFRLFNIYLKSKSSFIAFVPSFSIFIVPITNHAAAKHYQLAEGLGELICTVINETDMEAFTLTKEKREAKDGLDELLYSIQYLNFETSFRFRYDLNYLCPSSSFFFKSS